MPSTALAAGMSPPSRAVRMRVEDTGFSGDLYGTDPVVEFHAYLSLSKKFDTLDELRDCINNAAQRAQEYFK